MSNTCTLEVMVDLLTVYDAAEELFQICDSLIGVTVDSDSVVCQILKISDVIKRFSPLYNPYIDWEDSLMVRVLNDQTISREKRALKLLYG